MKRTTNKEEIILLNAMQVFTLKGFEDTMMYEVAEKSSTPLYVLLEFFEDKTGMYKQCLEYAEGILNNNIDLCRENRIVADKFCKSCKNKNSGFRYIGINPFMPVSLI